MRYLTERSRSVGRQGQRDFRRGPSGFVAPGSTVPPVDAPPAAAGAAAGGAVTLPLWALAASALGGIGLGYYATHGLKPQPVPIPYRKRSANPGAWHWSDTSPLVYGGGGFGSTVLVHWRHAGCGHAIKWSNTGFRFGIPGSSDPFGDGHTCGEFMPTWAFAFTYDSPADALDAQSSPITGMDAEHNLVEEYAVDSSNPGTHAEQLAELQALASPKPFYVPSIWFPNEFPFEAPIMWPGNPVPQSYPDAVPDVPFPVSPEFLPDIAPPVIEVPPFPVILVPSSVPDTTPGGPPAPAPGAVPDPVTGGDFPNPYSPGVWPIQEIEAQPDGSVRGRFLPPPDFSEGPPDKGEKQRKINVQSAIPRTWLYLNALTEADEFVDDLWRALPRSMRSKRYVNGKRRKTRTDQKLKDLYRHWQDADVPLIIENVFNDQLGDMFYAAPGRAAKAARRAMWNSTGVDPLIGLGSRKMTEGLSPPTPGSHNRKNALRRGARRITARTIKRSAGTFFGSGLSG